MNKLHFKKLKFKKELSKTQKIDVNKVQKSLKSNEPVKKEKKTKNKKDKIAKIITIIVAVICAGFIAGVATICVLLIGKPELNPNDFTSQESSVIYDRDGDIISELGQTIRKNITYDDLPTSLIDAFVAVEDSRFFEHNGFDIPRFAKAILENLRTFSFGQGGSTFTMQLVKNTYFVDDEAGVGAAKSIKRKVQEIALAIELENNPSVSKKDIFTAYLNKLYFGGTGQNIRGVQKAAQYYFGKDVNELSLPESAMLAGVINAPNLYNPYNHMDYAQERRDEVLYLMKYHGYISNDEYKLAIKTNVEDFLTDEASNTRGSGQGTPYQAYVDEVVDEVYELTGLDPYTTSMKIYTAMDKKIQTKMDEIQAEKVDEKYQRKTSDGEIYFYPDDKWEVASICVDNVTGEIYGILGGRNYADGGALLLNHATQQRKQPGSSIKPILDYSQAFEVLGWATSHYITDKPVTYPGTGILIGNSNGAYQGDIPLKHAVYESLNTTAILTLQKLIENENAGPKYLTNYLNTIGFDVDPAEFNVQYGIGGSSLEVTPLQMAGAQAMLINQGKYNKPHAVTKIEFLNEKPPIVYETNTVQAISPEAAYLTTELLKFNVSGNVTKEDGSHYANLMELFQDKDYQVYAKTGTTNWDSSAKVYGIPNGSIKDGWTIASTSKVTIATWMGYEKAEKEDDVVYGYIPYSIYNQNIKGKITKMILNTTIDTFGIPKAVERPEGIQSIKHITIPGTPYVAPVEGMPEEYIATGLIKKSKYSLVDPQTTGIEQMDDSVEISYDSGTIHVHMPSYPNPSSTASGDHHYDISLYGSDGSLKFFSEPIYGRKSFDYAWLYGAIRYKVDLKVNGETFKSETFDVNDVTINIQDYLNNGTIPDGGKIKAVCYYSNDSGSLASNRVSSNEVSIDNKISFTVPASGTVEQYKAFFERYTSNIQLVQAAPDGGNPGDVLSITLANDATRVLSKGSSYNFSRSEFTGVVISYVPNVNKELIITTQDGIITVGQQVVFTATPSGFTPSSYTWYINDEQMQTGSSSTYSYTPDSTEQFTVKAVADDNGQQIEKSATYVAQDSSDQE